MAGGFTLIDILAALAVLGFALTLIVARGLIRSRGGDLTFYAVRVTVSSTEDGRTWTVRAFVI